MRRVAAADPDRLLALAATGALAAGTVLALAGAAGAGTLTAVAGGGLAAAGLVTLIAAGLASGVVAVALAAPLPAVYSAGDARVAAVAPVAAGAVLAWAIRRGVGREPLRLGALPRRSLLLLGLALLAATALADDVALSAREALNFLLLLGLLAAAVDELSAEPRLAATLVDALVASAGVSGVLAVLQCVGKIPGDFPRWGTPYQRAALGFGQPNGLGLFLALLLPLAIHRFCSSRGAARLAFGAAAASAMLGLVATFSRENWVAIVAAVGALALAGRPRLALRAGLSLLAAGVAVELVSGGMLRDTAERTVGDWVVQQRLLILLAAVRMFLDHPLLGVGPGGFADQVEHYAARIPGLWDLQDTPHNAYAQMAAEAGVVGLAAYLLFLAACFAVLHRAARRRGPAHGLDLALYCSLVALTVASFGIWPFAHGTGEVVILLLALGFSRSRREAP